MQADYHVHTEFSDDSVYKMKDIVKDAIALGIEEICFTDHVDYGVKRDWNDPRGIEYRSGGPGEPKRMAVANVNYPAYVRTIRKLQEQFGHRIRIKLGMEFGMQTHTVSQFDKLFHSYPFDFIILSVHQVENLEFWNQDFQKGRTQQEYNQQYYEEIGKLVRVYKDYSVLGHLDSITRYDKQGIYPFEKTADLIADILQTVIADGKGLEVNTSSHRYGLKDLTPSRDILRLYKELGGNILTIGSDSHKKAHLGAYIEETKSELSALGFETFCTYDKMQPVFHEIEKKGSAPFIVQMRKKFCG